MPAVNDYREAMAKEMERGKEGPLRCGVCGSFGELSGGKCWWCRKHERVRVIFKDDDDGTELVDCTIREKDLPDCNVVIRGVVFDIVALIIDDDHMIYKYRVSRADLGVVSFICGDFKYLA